MLTSLSVIIEISALLIGAVRRREDTPARHPAGPGGQKASEEEAGQLMGPQLHAGASEQPRDHETKSNVKVT